LTVNNIKKQSRFVWHASRVESVTHGNYFGRLPYLPFHFHVPRYVNQMDLNDLRLKGTGKGFLNDQFLVAMPGMGDDRFARSVIYICAHSDDGAMGFIINQPQPIVFPEILLQLGVLREEEIIKLPEKTRDFPVRNGGPVDRSRGFVIHSDDYMVGSTLPVSEEICLTATVDILRAILAGRGPRNVMMMLGYACWSPGQLESEIAANGWLTCQASENILFGKDFEHTYDRVMASMGIDPSRLSIACGHA
jgi:putative transcriptional regulator